MTLSEFRGKHVVVTGGTSGIGKEIAKDFCMKGANVLVMGTSQEKSDKLRVECADFLGSISISLCDISNYKEVELVINDYIKRVSAIDIVVHSAGITKDALLMRMDEMSFDDVISVNLKGAFNIAKLSVRNMLKNRIGRIIFIASVLGVKGNPGQSNYCASKFGVIGFAKAMAREVASRGVTVNVVAPGFIESAMTDKLSDDQKDKIRNSIPLGYFGSTRDVSSATLFLASEDAKYITGHVLTIDGGMTA